MQHSPKLSILYLLRTDEAWHLEYIFSLAEGEKRKAFPIYIIIAVGPRCCWSLSPRPCSFQRDTSQHFRRFLSSSQCLALPAPSPCSLKLVKTTRPQSWWKPDLHWVCMTDKGRTVLQLCVALGMKNVVDHQLCKEAHCDKHLGHDGYNLTMSQHWFSQCLALWGTDFWACFYLVF